MDGQHMEEMVRILGVSKANVSQHLALLRHAGLVTARRAGLYVYYKIVDPEIIKPCVILYNLWVSGARHRHTHLFRRQKVRVSA
jgi:DNA-binding transcriptional ArsR family regulator